MGTGKFALNTDVPVERSRAEIEQIVSKYGATGFASGWMGSRVVLSFDVRDRRVRFSLDLPPRDDRRFTHATRRTNQHATSAQEVERPPAEAMKLWEQACRQKWRALALAIKAKLEAVESEIATFEEEFLSYVVMPNGMTIGERLVPQLGEMTVTGNLPPLLEGPAKHGRRTP